MTVTKDAGNRNMPAMVMVPEDKLEQLICAVTSLGELHLKLIGLYEKESRLKKQHKPYLYVREYADEVCREDKVLVNQIVREVLDPESTKIVKQDKDGKTKTQESERKEFDPEKCRDCLRYEDCEEFYMQLRAAERKKTKDEKSEGGTKEQVKAVPDHSDNFSLPDGLVLMSTETLGSMQDDMLRLTEAMDQLVGILRAGVNGSCVRRADAEKAVNMGSHLSDEVFRRWDNADFAALA